MGDFPDGMAANKAPYVYGRGIGLSGLPKIYRPGNFGLRNMSGAEIVPHESAKVTGTGMIHGYVA
jgi:hypothetical protein